MNERALEVWIRQYSGLPDNAAKARILSVLKAQKDPDALIRQAIERKMTLSEFLNLIKNGSPVSSEPEKMAPRSEPVPPVVRQAPAVIPSVNKKADKKKLEVPPFVGKAWEKAKGLLFDGSESDEETNTKFYKNKVFISISVVVSAFLVAGALFLFVALGNRADRTAALPSNFSAELEPSEVVSDTYSATTLEPVVTGDGMYDPLPVTSSAQEKVTLSDKDQTFWNSLGNVQVKELSPGNLGWKFNAKTSVGIFLMFVLTLWAVGEGAVRKKGQNGALFFAIVALLAGWLTLPVLIMISTAKTGWFFLGMMFLALLWGLSISTVKSQGDLSPITVAIALFTASLFYVGKLTVISTIGFLFGAIWPAWTGVTNIGGLLTLLISGRGASAVLTFLIVVLSSVVLYLSSKEVGKKHGYWSSAFIGFVVIVVFALSNWGLNAGVTYLLTTSPDMSASIAVVLKVLAPVLAWVVSLLASVGIGVAMGDVEVGRDENRQKLGLSQTGGFIQNIADFGILGTIVPLFLGVIVQIF